MYVSYFDEALESTSTSKGSSACTIRGLEWRESRRRPDTRSSLAAFPKSSIPEGDMKALNPIAPASTMPNSSAWLEPSAPEFSGTRPPQNPTSTKILSFATRIFSLRMAAVVAAGLEFRGMSSSVVTPPAAAALVAVSKPSQSALPGSLTWTWRSTRPGETTRSP